jgi:hypothetical protein
MKYFRLKDQEEEEDGAVSAINAEAKKDDPARYTKVGAARRTIKRGGSGQVQQGF